MALALPLGLAFLMFVVGARLTLADLSGVLRKPRALFIGLGVQTLMLPLLALLLAWAFALPPQLAAGLLVVAAAPGGITSNYVTWLAAGDVALSTAMTLITSLLASLTIPLVLHATGVLTQGDMAAPLAQIAKMGAGMAAMTAVPLALGLFVKHRFPLAAAKAGPGVDLLSKAVFGAIVLATFVQNWDALMLHAGAAGPAVIALNLAAVATALGVTRAAGLSRPQQFAIAIESGLQNVAMAIIVASVLLQDSALAIPSLLYAIIMNVTAFVLVGLGRQALRAAPAARA